MKIKTFIGTIHFCSNKQNLSMPVNEAHTRCTTVCSDTVYDRFYYYENKSRANVCGGHSAQPLFGHQNINDAWIYPSSLFPTIGIGGSYSGRIPLSQTRYYNKHLTRRKCP